MSNENYVHYIYLEVIVKYYLTAFIIIMAIVLNVGCTKKDAAYFNMKAALPQYKASEVVKALNLKEGNVVADIGAGGGYFSFLFAKKVKEKGIVYAVEINKKYIEYINALAQKKKISNIKTLFVESNKFPIADKTLDFIFVRNVYHHLSNRSDYFKGLKPYLKAKGKIVIIDFKQNNLFQRLRGNVFSIEIVKKEMNAAGYKVFDKKDFLDKQMFLIFDIK